MVIMVNWVSYAAAEASLALRHSHYVNTRPVGIVLSAYIRRRWWQQWTRFVAYKIAFSVEFKLALKINQPPLINFQLQFSISIFNDQLIECHKELIPRRYFSLLSMILFFFHKRVFENIEDIVSRNGQCTHRNWCYLLLCFVWCKLS